jgi:hypothetical protein
VRALCRRVMRPQVQLGVSILITLFAAYAWWRSRWGAGESALFAAMIGVTAYQWTVALPRQASKDQQP